jgi:tetratricopeptide (TPR) repeat protein
VNSKASLLLGLIVFLVFSSSLSDSFVWDDEQFVQKNVFLTSPKYLPKLFTENVVAGAGLESNLYRPFQSLTHFADTRIWGNKAFGHHLTNVLLHSAAAAAVFRLFASLAPPGPAWIAACLFALHPLQSETVAYVSGRGDTLAVFFLSLCLLCFERRPRLSFLFACLAVLSKESMVLAPVFLVLYQAAKGRSGGWRRQLPFWALSGAYVTARLTILNFQNTLNFYKEPNVFTENFLYRFYTYCTTLVKGLFLWLWPYDLHHERSWPVFASFQNTLVWGSFVILAILIVTALLARKKDRLYSVGVAWFFLATFPTSNLVVLINAIFYDHWFLLPGLGLCLAALSALSRLWAASLAAKRVSIAVCAVLIAALSGAAIHYNRIWRAPVSLYSHILSWEPRSAKISSNLGMAYADEGRFDEAITYYQKAIELSDEYPQTHHNLANIYMKQGNSDKALEEYHKALGIDPNFYHSLMQMGIVYLGLNELEKAEEAFTRSLEVYPFDPNAYVGLAQVARLRGDLPVAASFLERGLKVLPEDKTLSAALQKMAS